MKVEDQIFAAIRTIEQQTRNHLELLGHPYAQTCIGVERGTQHTSTFTPFLHALFLLDKAKRINMEGYSRTTLQLVNFALGILWTKEVSGI